MSSSSARRERRIREKKLAPYYYRVAMDAYYNGIVKPKPKYIPLFVYKWMVRTVLK